MVHLGHIRLVVLTALAAPACGFVGSLEGGRKITRLFGNTKQPSSAWPDIKDISYGEESRKYRRTVYSHDDWRKFRSPDRFPYDLRTFINSGIYKNLAREVMAATFVAAFIVLFNAIIGGYVDFEGVKHDPLITSSWIPQLGLPQDPFVLSSPALSLLLGTCPMHTCTSVAFGGVETKSTIRGFSIPQSFEQIHRTSDGTKHARTGE